MRLLTTTLLFLIVSACSEQAPGQQEPVPLEIFRCQLLLIGQSEDVCREDIIAPGTLRISFKPDPVQSSWELSLSGLAALADACEFHGSFDQTRLAALQGRGETELVCPISPGVDRAYHALQFENRTETVNGSISISVVFSR